MVGGDWVRDVEEGVEEGVEAVSRPGNGVAEWILTYCKLTRCDLLAMVTALTNPHNRVETLDLFASKIGDELLQVLLSGACTHANNHMALLDLRGNKIGLQGAKAIATALQHPNNHIRELNLKDNNFGGSCWTISLAMMCPTSNLQVLDLTNNKIDNCDVATICRALKHDNNHLLTLVLSHNDIGDGAAMEIALALQHPSNKLLRLALCECGVGDIGAMAMALTHACNRVRELDLSYNRVRDGGAKHLAKALIHPHNKLTRLELVGNGVTRQGGKAIAGAFRHVNCRVSRAGDFCANAKHALYDAIAFQRLLVLLSARQVRRIGKHSALKRLPVELIRLVSQTCRIAKRDGYDWTV